MYRRPSGQHQAPNSMAITSQKKEPRGRGGSALHRIFNDKAAP